MVALVGVLLAVFWAAYRTREQQPGERARVERAQTGDAPTVATTTPATPPPTATDGDGASPNQLPRPAQVPPPVPAPDSATTGDVATLRSHRRSGEMTASAPATVALIDGERRVTFDRAGNLRGLESLPPDMQRSITQALINGRAATPRALDKLTGNTGVLMGDSAGASEGGGTNDGVPFALVAPVGKVVRTEQPMFSWRPLNGANGYTVAIVDAKFNVVELERASDDKRVDSLETASARRDLFLASDGAARRGGSRLAVCARTAGEVQSAGARPRRRTRPRRRSARGFASRARRALCARRFVGRSPPRVSRFSEGQPALARRAKTFEERAPEMTGGFRTNL